MALPIEDCAIIGDRHTGALVGLDGSVDWLCLPRFDSAACFAALLGEPEHGRWLIGPADPDEVETTRAYEGATTHLVTTFSGPTGTVTVHDSMPRGDRRADLVRTVTGVSGSLRMRHEWVVRFAYGAVRPWVRRAHRADGEEVIVAVAGPDQLVLSGPRLPAATDHRHADELEVHEGDVLTFALTWAPSWHPVPDVLDSLAVVRRDGEEQERWAEPCAHDLPHRDLVVRSLATLRALTHVETGGIVAALTTSLPEDFGGERNWDYRFCWLRDASLTLTALLDAGYTEEAEAWRRWLVRAVAAEPADLQFMYGVDGSRELPERELDHLPGYAGSRPVRIGNGAAAQLQTDVFGSMMIAFDTARRAGLEEDLNSWRIQCAMLDHLAGAWREPDHGMWEVRGPRQRFTHSQVMAWVAFDRGVRAVEELGLEGRVDRWREARDAVREAVLADCVDPERGCFVQHPGTTEVDAALLQVPMVGFLPGDDPRVLATIRAVEEDLLRDGLLLRYRTGSGVDGLAGDEHPFLACSFWLVDAYVLAGRTDEAAELLDRLVGLVNDVGLLSEEYDVAGARMVGNFPQAFSHLALVRSAISLRREQASDPNSAQR
jgi:GH15 family glucan-1,4-alpha-glucosidase